MIGYPNSQPQEVLYNLSKGVNNPTLRTGLTAKDHTQLYQEADVPKGCNFSYRTTSSLYRLIRISYCTLDTWLHEYAEYLCMHVVAPASGYAESCVLQLIQ